MLSVSRVSRRQQRGRLILLKRPERTYFHRKSKEAGPVHAFNPQGSDYLVVGLNSKEIEERKQLGLMNEPFKPPTRTEKEIILGNLLTLFNFLNFGLAFLIIFAGLMKPMHFRNLAFMGVVLSNLFIGIVQGIRAKRTIDRLSILTEPRTFVLRSGEKVEIHVADIVLDDLLLMESGHQMSVDGVVHDCEGFEVDESLLTGESEPVRKKPGERVYAGSLIVAGSARVQVTGVGKNTYAAGITIAAKTEKKQQSELRATLQKILKSLTFVILPIGLLLFISKFSMAHGSLPDVIVSSVAALIGMIPEGLILLTEIAFAVAIINLGKYRVLVQIMPAVEMLARIDTLCLDKTGTLTTGKMLVKSFVPLTDEYDEEALKAVISTCVWQQQTQNATQKALEAYFDKPYAWKVSQRVSFSSKRKWSGVRFEEKGTFLVGASEFILRSQGTGVVDDILVGMASRGQRVILVARAEEPFNEEQDLPGNIEPLCLIGIEDELREDAKKTLDYFKQQQVELKIISGDYPETVSALARRAGFESWDQWIDMSSLEEGSDLSEIVSKYHIFGRVDPYQKKDILEALQLCGHTVAMTGDGVNDVPALRRADCSIAMVSGSSAARASADIVLLENSMSSLIPAVYEGRRVINNIERVASLFLVKTTYSTLLSLLYIFIPETYPVFPIQMTLIGVFTIGVPSFFLALKPDKSRVQGGFFEKILLRAIPAGLSAVGVVMLLEILGPLSYFSDEEKSTMVLLLLGFIGFYVLFRAMLPLNLFKVLLWGTLVSIFSICVFFFPEIFFLEPIISRIAWIYLPLMGVSVLLIYAFEKIGQVGFLQKIRRRLFLRKGKRKNQ